MSLEFKLSISLKERTLELVPDQPTYVCIVEVGCNDKTIEHSFVDGLKALEYIEKLYREWLNIIISMKRDTIQERKALKKRLGEVIKS